MTHQQLIYLYCVTQREPNQEVKTGLGDNIYVISHDDLGAIVGNVNESEFNEQSFRRNLTNLEWVTANANRHERVVEQVMADYCVIPFKFGTLFNTQDTLKAMLKEYKETLKTLLSKSRDKEEWGIKVYWDKNKLVGNLMSEDPEVLQIEKDIKSSSLGKAFFLKKKKEKLITCALDKNINECCRQTFESLKEFSFDACINKVLPKGAAERKEDMVLNSAFWVGKDNVRSFVDTVYSLKKQYENNGFLMDCTGPWPPYNFCLLGKETTQNG
ncbi:MAG: GvpL/GvpF family gas vesicle protein [Phycisphaerae bacterium]